MKFALGSVVITGGCQVHMERLGVDPVDFLMRHLNGDWGDLSAGDKRLNDEAIKHGNRTLSRYTLPDGESIYIITEHDRSYTTITLCDEY